MISKFNEEINNSNFKFFLHVPILLHVIRDSVVRNLLDDENKIYQLRQLTTSMITAAKE
jgi:hypothetical protein